jgi:hypothetical protein
MSKTNDLHKETKIFILQKIFSDDIHIPSSTSEERASLIFITVSIEFLKV